MKDSVLLDFHHIMKEMNIIKNEIDGTDCAALSTRIKVEYHETGWGGVGWDGMGWDDTI